ncbi:MAG: class I SAM-dependent methyltransferase [Proteobacteria bacterium]|nr:class I SAM-dependent methyltransferase [Pseudomonadota bacterium]MBU1716784.1 class I SAM-dependent methyltransferase [Pseudomonadota bacterium]
MQEKATALAANLALALVEQETADYDFFLVPTNQRLELRQAGPKAPGPLSVDFTTGATAYRRLKGGGKRQTLVRAIGIKGAKNRTVLDATAGLGRDAFVLACHGCSLILMERDPIIAALLEDGLQRAAVSAQTAQIMQERMQFIAGDLINPPAALQDMDRPEVIYLDPMYPHRTKSALVKKEMRMIRAITGDDEDAPKLLTAALQYAKKRVVVKRPKTAPAIAGPPPATSIKSKNSRFDIYLI